MGQVQNWQKGLAACVPHLRARLAAAKLPAWVPAPEAKGGERGGQAPLMARPAVQHSPPLVHFDLDDALVKHAAVDESDGLDSALALDKTAGKRPSVACRSKRSRETSPLGSHDERKPAWLLCRTIQAHNDALDGATSAEERMKLRVDRHESKVSDIDRSARVRSARLRLFSSHPAR
jgi:hypothetical protein